MKNITFSAADDVIAQARALAQSRRTTLNEEFRLWLASYVQQQNQAQEQKRASLRKILDQLTTPAAGQTIVPAEARFKPQNMHVAARDALNERELRMLDRLSK